ncbi:MAG: hypothetical protein JWO67_33 [Streptosporangiaceae bacterium]|nr:hypothetical protein [Streptosporangiaceae bacterium]
MSALLLWLGYVTFALVVIVYLVTLGGRFPRKRRPAAERVVRAWCVCPVCTPVTAPGDAPRTAPTPPNSGNLGAFAPPRSRVGGQPFDAGVRCPARAGIWGQELALCCDVYGHTGWHHAPADDRIILWRNTPADAVMWREP